MRTATDLLAEMLAIYEDPEKGIAGLGLWLHHEKEEVRAVVERGAEVHVRETDDSDIERAHWAIQRGIAKLRVTEFYTYSVEFEHYSTCFGHLNAAIACMSVYAANYGVDRARGEGE